MSENNRRLPLLLLAGAAVVMVLLWSLNPADVEKEAAASQVPVEVITLEPASKRFTIESQGTITAQNTTSLVAEVSGRIIEFSDAFQAGRFFHKGEVLVRLDDLDYRAGVAKAEAVLAQQEVKLAIEKAMALQAQEGAESLGREDRVTALALREPYVDEARALVASARADLDRARIKLDRTSVIAPYDGFVLSRDVGLGQYLASGTSIGRVFSAEQALVRLPVTDRQLAMIPLRDRRHGADALPPQKMEIRCDQLEIELARNEEDPSGFRKAWVCGLEAQRDPESRVQYLQVRLDDPYLAYGGPAAEGQPLSVGTYVIARIPSHEYDDVFEIPRSAVHEGDRVLIVDDDNRLRWRAIDIFHADADSVYVRGGVTAGERLSVSPLDVAVEGMQIDIVAADRAATAPER